MKLAVLGGGGVRMPLLVRAILQRAPDLFEEIRLLDLDLARRSVIGGLCVELARRTGKEGCVRVTGDEEEALEGVDYVFSAIRVGGDIGRVIDEHVALKRGLVGQETVGAGGCAMALRAIPEILRYCEVVKRVAPEAVVISFTNPAGIITQAVDRFGGVPVVGICDTPSEMVRRLAAFLNVPRDIVAAGYGGLNHLGWVNSLRVGGSEIIDEVIGRYGELRRKSGYFAPFDAAAIRSLGAIPSEYVSYYCYPERYKARVASAGRTRGEQVLTMNEELVARVGKALVGEGFERAWGEYETIMAAREESYMRIELGDGGGLERRRVETGTVGEYRNKSRGTSGSGVGGYEGIAMDVMLGLAGEGSERIIVNTRNGNALPFLEGDDVVEVSAMVSAAGIDPLVGVELPGAARGLVTLVKEYERQLLEAAVEGSLEKASMALSLNPLVPGVDVARELVTEYVEAHGGLLQYLK